MDCEVCCIEARSCSWTKTVHRCAQSTHARAWLAHGACKFYRCAMSYSLTLRQLLPASCGDCWAKKFALPGKPMNTKCSHACDLAFRSACLHTFPSQRIKELRNFQGKTLFAVVALGPGDALLAWPGHVSATMRLQQRQPAHQKSWRWAPNGQTCKHATCSQYNNVK